STRLRVFQRALRSRVERSGTLLEIMRAVNGTLDPAGLADIILDHAGAWIPAPCWAVVSADSSGQLTVLADRGLTPEIGPAIFAIATWVMQRGEEFSTADLRTDSRIADQTLGTVLAFLLSSRGHRVGVLIGMD